MRRTAVVAPLLAGLLITTGIVGLPIAAGQSTTWCRDVAITIVQEMPAPGRLASQDFSVGSDCRVRLGKPAERALESLSAGSEGQLSSRSDAIGSSTQSVATLASVSYRAYAATQIWDCCGILLTEHWIENTWTTSNTSTGVITAWGAVHGASWHREGGGQTGWNLDPNNQFLGLVGGGLNQTFEKVKGTQGFSYQGVFDPTGTLFYNRLTDYVQGNRNSSYYCVHDYFLKKVPAGPLAWKPQVLCGRGFYPNR